MDRTDILRKLRAYQSRWEAEAETTDRFIDFVASHPNCFERSLPTGHVTGSAWVVNRAATHVLLTHHRKLDRWLQLGGHADGDPDIARVAAREVWEESGLMDVVMMDEDIFDIDIHRIPARGADPEHDHYDIRFLMQATGSDRYTVSDESHDLQWINIHEVDTVTTEESMIRMAKKCQAAVIPAPSLASTPKGHLTQSHDE